MNLEKYRPAFEKFIRDNTHKYLSKDYAVERNIDSHGNLLDYKKYETRHAWNWYVKGLQETKNV